MNAIFKRKKSPEQLVKCLKDALHEHETLNHRTRMSSPASAPAPAPVAGSSASSSSSSPVMPPHSPLDTKMPPVPQALVSENHTELTKRLGQIKTLLYGEEGQESNPQKCQQTAECLMSEHLFNQLILRLRTLPFEARKHVSQIYNNLMRRDLGNFIAYMSVHPDLIHFLMCGYDDSEIALNCGSMLRESLRHEVLTKIVLSSTEFWRYFDIYVHLPNFDVASDAFASLKDILSRHKSLVSEFFEIHFDQVFDKYNSLLESENYVTRRQSLKLLGEILLDRSNFNTMMRYISKRENLKMMMNLLRDKSANIQFEAFHVFKVFVANPKKPADITQILINNREKLILYLQKFQNEKEDEQFVEEKTLLIKTLANLEPAKVVVESTGAGSSST